MKSNVLMKYIIMQYSVQFIHTEANVSRTGRQLCAVRRTSAFRYQMNLCIVQLLTHALNETDHVSSMSEFNITQLNYILNVGF